MCCARGNCEVGARLTVAVEVSRHEARPLRLTSTDIAPGASVELTERLPGNHHFQRCIHPWVRGIVKVR